MSDLEHAGKSRWKSLVLDRLIELVIVFISVYAAFLLNAYQIRQGEDQRRAQLLTYLLEQSTGGAAQLHQTVIDYDRSMNTFLDQLAKGEMPPIDTFGWASSYNENDTGWILEAGGLELLNIRTIAALREVDTVARTGLAIMMHYQKLSDELIAPHLGDQSYFYDPATRKLRPIFQNYPKMLHDGSRFLHRLSETRDRLAAQLQAEQKRLR